MNITQSFNLIASAILLSTVAACSQTNAPVDSANQVRAFGPTENVQGSQAAALTNNTWLISSESQGLQLIDEMGNSHTLQSGNFETLSVKALDNGHYLVASIDNETDQAVIFKLQKDAQWQLKTLSRITPDRKSVV